MAVNRLRACIHRRENDSMKTILFIPGFGEGVDDRDYPALLRLYEEAGYASHFVRLKWSRTTLHHWVREFNQIYAHYEPSEAVLAGFSFGAVTAFMAASERVPNELWLYSMSPYFHGDKPKKAWTDHIGIRRTQAFREIDFDNLAKKIHCKAKVFYGELEGREVEGRAKTAARKLPNAQLISVPGAGHDVADVHYLAAIKKHF